MINRIRNKARRVWLRREMTNSLRVRARAVAETRPSPADPRPVVVFNASTRLGGLSLNAAFSLISSWGLQMAGARVIHFACGAGMSRCVLGTNKDDPAQPPPCKDCVAQSKANTTAAEARWFEWSTDAALENRMAGLSVDALAELEYQGLALGELTLPTLRWVLRRHHLADDEATRFLFRSFIASAWNVARNFLRLLEEENPRAVLVFNGQFFPEAVVRKLAMERGIKVVAHEVGLQPYTGFFTTGEATAYPIDIPSDFELSVSQAQRLDAYLAQRFQGNFSMAGVRFWPEMIKLDPRLVERAAQFQQVVPVFTNVIFDTSQSHANVVFEDMFAWLDRVLEIARQHPETLFVIRAHPDEARPGKESRESVAEWAKKNRLEMLNNVWFVDANEYLSSYELIDRAKFVMVYNSTIGLEASLMGAAVLCAGKARFTQLETVFFPQSRPAFDQAAEEFLAAEKIEVPVHFRENARRFLYYQLFKTSLPFDAFIEEDGVWRGYVRLKPFTPADLSVERSETMKTIVDGILGDGNLLLGED
ncbi:MAG: hypothetical protein GYA48_05765 [Chloroflexi bacterium]|nr:hypothetical protein [Chloroflexota bacterium]